MHNYNYKWKLRNKTISLGGSPLIMGILNATPDSFSDGGRFNTTKKATNHALKMIDDGADIIDIGGESTRPGSKQISLNEEINRTIPIIKSLRKLNDSILISIDTSKSEVARLAMEEGADIINDVTSYNNDLNMPEIVRKYEAGIILMHMQGTPENMQIDPSYDNVIGEVSEFLNKKILDSIKSGILKESIIIDPGIGFGKNINQNLTLLKNLDKFTNVQPTLIGLSRKSFIGKIIGEKDPKGRLAGSLGATAFSIIQGAHILRVHDVKETRDVCEIFKHLH
tara:strand:- start:1795 stop:2640 length:846 start_codon:yes stop_codon:yes gene_type:complete